MTCRLRVTRAWNWGKSEIFDSLRELDEYGGIDLVGLRQDVHGFGESANASWRDDRHGIVVLREVDEQIEVIDASGLKDDLCVSGRW